MRILCDVVLKACPVENACRELSVERHGAYSLVGRGVPFPGVSRKRTGIDRSHWNLQGRPARSRRWRNGARAGCAGPGPDAGGTRRVIWTRDYARYGPAAQFREGYSAARRHPSARAYSRSHRAQPGGRCGLRHHRRHPPKLHPLPPGRGSGSPPRAGSRAKSSVARRNDPDHPRIQLFLPPREHRRGPAPHPKDPRACGRFSSARGQHRSCARPRAESWDRTFRPPEVLRERPDLPGLTAHPTEVRRKSTIDREMEVAALLAERDRIRLTAEEERATEEALARAVLILWQTSILRRTRLKVVDEVANGLSYYDYTFLRELPRVYAEIEDQLAMADPAWKATELPSFLHMGSWIGGDRDGNPFVTAEVLHQALRMQSRRALSFYLDELHL